MWANRVASGQLMNLEARLNSPAVPPPCNTRLCRAGSRFSLGDPTSACVPIGSPTKPPGSGRLWSRQAFLPSFRKVRLTRRGRSDKRAARTTGAHASLPFENCAQEADISYWQATGARFLCASASKCRTHSLEVQRCLYRSQASRSRPYALKKTSLATETRAMQRRFQSISSESTGASAGR